MFFYNHLTAGQTEPNNIQQLIQLFQLIAQVN